MKQLLFIVFCIVFLLTNSHCDNEVVPHYGYLKLTVMYPEVIIESDTIYWNQVPGVGAEVRLYDGEARCYGYRDARIDVAWIGENPVASEYASLIDESGEVLFTDIPAEEYYLVVFAREIDRYTEKYIRVSSGDTLKLSKVFTPDGQFLEDLEPWDYEMPPLY